MTARTSFTPEQELLCWAIGLDREPALPDPLLTAEKVDWQLLRRLAIDHGILPLVYRRLKALNKDSVPAAEISRLRDVYFASSAANLHKEQKLLQILELFSAHGIEAMVFKGPVLALQAYGDPSLRQYNDLDILIHRHDFRTAYGLMNGEDYAPQFAVDEKREKWLTGSDIELQFSDPNGLLVELHWEMSERSNYFQIGADTVWRNRRTIELHGREVSMPAPEHTLIMLWLHGSRHRWDKLKLVADLVHLVHASPPEVLDAARENLPPRYRDRFAGEIGNPRMLAQAVFSAGGYRDVKERLCDLATEIFKPRATDWLAVDLPDRLYPLYYLIRPVRLALKYGRRTIGSRVSD